MPRIHVKLYPGRTDEQKAELANRIIKATMEVLNVKETSTHVTFEEIPKEEGEKK